MRITILSCLLFYASIVNGQQQISADTITNQMIIQLHKAGLSGAILKSKIESSPTSFDLSVDGLIALKKAGISDEVIKAMLTKTSQPLNTPQTSSDPVLILESGIYYIDSVSKETLPLEASILTNQKRGGFGEALKRSLISPLINAKIRASLSGSSANAVLPQKKPTFVFVFDTTHQGGLNNNSTYFGAVQSPNEFFLVMLTVSKNSREVVVGKSNAVSSDIGIEDKLKIKFTFTKKRKGVFEVVPESPLPPGEYCFMYAASSLYSGMTHKVYDFSIK